MAGPLTGAGQQQVSFSNPFQPGGSDQTRALKQQEQQQRSSETQVRGTPTAKSEETKTAQGKKDFETNTFSSVNNDNGSAQRRGSIVNLVV